MVTKSAASTCVCFSVKTRPQPRCGFFASVLFSRLTELKTRPAVRFKTLSNSVYFVVFCSNLNKTSVGKSV